MWLYSSCLGRECIRTKFWIQGFSSNCGGGEAAKDRRNGQQAWPWWCGSQVKKVFQEGRSDNCIICRWKMTQIWKRWPWFYGSINKCTWKKLCVNIYILIFCFSFCISRMRTVLWRVTFALVQCHSRSFMVLGVRNPFQNSLAQRVAFFDWHNWNIWSTLASNTAAFRGSNEEHESSVSFFQFLALSGGRIAYTGVLMLNLRREEVFFLSFYVSDSMEELWLTLFGPHC